MGYRPHLRWWERRKQLMLGIDDPWILSGYALDIGFALACIVYGWWKRNEVEKEED